jgi:hypothetical protein
MLKDYEKATLEERLRHYESKTIYENFKLKELDMRKKL